jgi:phosphate transport system permease protein
VFDYLGWSSSALAFLVLATAMVWILVTVFRRGFGAISFKALTEVTQGVGGGLLNAIEGTLLLVCGGVVLAVPPGLAAGMCLAEFDTG